MVKNMCFSKIISKSNVMDFPSALHGGFEPQVSVVFFFQSCGCFPENSRMEALFSGTTLKGKSSEPTIDFKGLYISYRG